MKQQQLVSRLFIGFFIAIVVVPCAFNIFRGDVREGAFAESDIGNLLQPFQGSWKYSPADSRALGTKNFLKQQIKTFDHQDITVQRQFIQFGDDSEYLLFDLHQHDDLLCGKAWYHESVHDPGDMSKCIIRLQISDGKLVMFLKQQDRLGDINDPDIRRVFRANDFTGSVQTCEFEDPAGKHWLDWNVFVFKADK